MDFQTTESVTESNNYSSLFSYKINMTGIHKMVIRNS